MYLPRTILLAFISATLGVQAQSGSYDSDSDLFARSPYDGDDEPLDLLYVRHADPAEMDDEDAHLLLTRDLHARVADLEDAILFARGGSGESSESKQDTQGWKGPTTSGGGKAGTAIRGASKILELATKKKRPSSLNTKKPGADAAKKIAKDNKSGKKSKRSVRRAMEE